MAAAAAPPTPFPVPRAPMVKARSSVRRAIVDYLRLVSSAESLLDYERRTPLVSVPEDLVSIWFDKLYRPSGMSATEDSMVIDRDLVQFATSFDQDELEAMEAFHELFEPRRHHVRGLENVDAMLADRHWRDVMGEAAKTLVAFVRAGERGERA